MGDDPIPLLRKKAADRPPAASSLLFCKLVPVSATRYTMAASAGCAIPLARAWFTLSIFLSSTAQNRLEADVHQTYFRTDRKM